MKRQTALVLALAVAGVLAPASLAADAQKFFKNYFVTGDYKVGGIGLRGQGVADTTAQKTFFNDPNNSSHASGTIRMSGVPAGADVLAAYLYWQTIESAATPTSSIGAFRGNRIIGKQVAPDGAAACWSSGGGSGTTSGAQKLRVYRADVLRYLPAAPANSPVNPGRLLVNDTDLTAAGFGLNTVSLPDSGGGGSNSAGTGNQAVYVQGTSLVVVFRAPGLPLKSVVIYDGGYSASQDNPLLTQTLQGFYQASSPKPAASLTYLVGDGDKNFKDRLKVNGRTISDNAFQGAQGLSWDNLTLDVSSLVNGNDSSITTSIEPVLSSIDCVSMAALIFSTTVKDTDNDGLLDIWESSSTTLKDPNGVDLPNLKAMGASPTVKDLFIQIDFMTSSGYDTPLGPVGPHSHLPSKVALDRVGDAFKNAPAAPNGPGPINVHFDVGANYQGDPYVIPAAYARGGKAIPETACDPSLEPCQFPDYPGTVGWKAGFQKIKLLNFDRNRKDIFHWSLFAHNSGRAMATVDDPATPYDERKTPKSTSGVSDAATGGGDFMVTLGRWGGDNFNGTDFMQAATLMHELGHNLALRHGGAPQEPNCKPNYQSVMNYLHQVSGLMLPTTVSIGRGSSSASVTAVIDYSRQELQPLDEASLAETQLKTLGGDTMNYLLRWNVPQSSYFLNNVLGTSAVRTRHCNGTPLTPAELANPYVRIDGTSLTAPVDWNANGVSNPPVSQDINYSGAINTSYRGFNDWIAIDLKQVGARRDANRLSMDVAPGDLDPSDPNAGSAADGSAADGSAADGSAADGSAADGSAADGSAADGSAADGSAADGSELDFDTAISIANGVAGFSATPTNRTVELVWSKPNLVANGVSITGYKLFRATGTVTTSNQPALLATVAATATTYSDDSAQNNRTYTYMIVVTFSDGTQSGASTVTVTK